MIKLTDPDLGQGVLVITIFKYFEIFIPLVKILPFSLLI